MHPSAEATSAPAAIRAAEWGWAAAGAYGQRVGAVHALVTREGSLTIPANAPCRGKRALIETRIPSIAPRWQNG